MYNNLMLLAVTCYPSTSLSTSNGHSRGTHTDAQRWDFYLTSAFHLEHHYWPVLAWDLPIALQFLGSEDQVFLNF